MASSTSNIDQLSQSQSSKEITINALLDAASPATLYGRRQSMTSGLTWGYYGGTILLGSTATQIANGTLTLAASATNYIQANPTTGAVTSNTTGFTAGFWQLYVVVTGVTTVTTYTDNRVLGQSLNSGFGNPMTTAGDLIEGGASGVPTRLAIGSNGQVLTVIAGAIAWAAATGGFANPMTAVGDIIIGGTGGVATRLGAGTNGQVLTLASGSPTWAAAPGGGFTGGTLASALNEAPPVTIASAATVAIGAAAANSITVSGTTAITAFDSIAAGAFRRVVFSGILTLTYNATSLILPTAANITTASGDVAEFISMGSGNWQCTSYTRASGAALVSSGGGLTNFTDTTSSAAPNATVTVSILGATGAATNVDATVKPKGTGAFLVAVPDNAATGGNKRGAKAVDLQLARATAAQVASGANSVIGGGINNTASSTGSFVGGGTSNAATTNQYATVVGGQSNIASGDSSFVGGGNSSTASGDNSVVGGGLSHTASGIYSAVCGGYFNTASGAIYAYVGGGQNNTASGTASTVGGGSANTASGDYACIPGGLNATTRNIKGLFAYSSGTFSAAGDAQFGKYVLRTSTPDATAKTVTTNGATASTVNGIILPNNAAYSCKGRVIARDNATGNASEWDVRCTITRGANAASTALVGTATVAMVNQSSGASSWVVALFADTTNGGLTVSVTGAASTTIKWVASIETVELTG